MDNADNYVAADRVRILIQRELRLGGVSGLRSSWICRGIESDALQKIIQEEIDIFRRLTILPKDSQRITDMTPGRIDNDGHDRHH